MMKKNNKRPKIYFLLTVLIDILLVVAVIYLMNYVQYLLNADTRINLTEIVTQNKDVITSKLMLEVNNLDLVSKQIAEQYSSGEEHTSESLKAVYLSYAAETKDSKLFLGLEDGTAVFPNATEVNISGRHYFRRAMEGRYNISERTVSRIDGEDMFVISMPLYYNDEVVGTIQKQYTPKEMYQICSVSLFSEQGSMYIINSQGYILINSQADVYNMESDNYFRMVYLTNPTQAKTLQEDIQNERAGFIEVEENGKTIFSAYTPIDQIYDWYLITSVDTKAVSPNGEIVIRLFYIVLSGVALFFAFSAFYYLTQKNKQQARLKKIAFVDTVTGGDTYTKFVLDLRSIMEEHPDKTYYLFSCDIDNFKYINSFYGFDTGDNILKKIYCLISEKLTENERIARVTSDHFAILLEDASEERMDSFFEHEIVIDDIKVYFSAGLYMIPNSEESANLMLDKANLAKQTTKGIQNEHIGVYLEEYDKQMIENEQIKRSVELALMDDEIIPFFQPKVDVNTRKLVGAEALARWKTKDGKFISPISFISVCEQTGLIVKVDQAIFEKTLRFIRNNLDKGVECVPISVNFSRMHLLNEQFVDILFATLQKYNVPPELIEIELTETIIFDNYEMIQTFINRLHESGFRISMDDFGSGYSSLHMLKDVNIDVLKIDREFLKETENSDRQKIIFATIAQMAQRLKIKVVVEGVETLENIQLMREFDCPIAQGYYFAKPMEEHLFAKLYEDGKV